MTHVVDVFWSFRSPYSYLVTPDLLRLREDFEVDVRLRAVLPIAVRAKEILFAEGPTSRATSCWMRRGAPNSWA
jgi:hypothetical protein